MKKAGFTYLKQMNDGENVEMLLWKVDFEIKWNLIIANRSAVYAALNNVASNQQREHL